MRVFYASLIAGALSFSLHGAEKPMEHFSEKFADLQVLRYEAKGFSDLSLKQKRFAYFLYKAALSGRDIIWDQNFKHNLTIRRTLEEILKGYKGDRNDPRFLAFTVYLKRVWFSNGIHHHYSTEKLQPGFDADYFRQLIEATNSSDFPTLCDESKAELGERLIPILFDPMVAPKKVVLDSSVDQVMNSAVNFFEGVTQTEVKSYYDSIRIANDPAPVSYGLNSKLVKENGNVVPKVYRVGGMYSEAIEKIVINLQKASALAETPLQAQALQELIRFYQTGDLRAFDRYNILWVQDTSSVVDAINGFIETYNDPTGHTGSFESVVSFKDLELSHKFSVLSAEAGWFEKNSPIADIYKRANPVGVSYKVITVLAESGDSSPSTPIGINLPNADWIRSQHGSKSVSLRNIEDAYAAVGKGNGSLQEFYLPEQQEWITAYGDIIDQLTTGLHEVIGHASGVIRDGVGAPQDTLGSYVHCLEEARADLVALYYIGDQHLVDLGLSPTTDIMKAEYTQYLVNGLYRQLVRIEEGKVLEEAHMRNRQLIASWVYERAKAMGAAQMIQVDGKTFLEIKDFEVIRGLVGQLLAEVQRIKSEGDYEAGKALVEKYAVSFDPALHKEILARWKKLDIAPYSGFINPKLELVRSGGKLLDVVISYPENFTQQMLDYAARYSYLPNYN